MSFSPSIFVPLPFSCCMESMSYVFSFRVVFFVLVTTGWIFYIRLCMIITYSKSMDQPGKVANPARGQLNRENEYFPVTVHASEFFGLARRIWQSRPASAC